jgi:hypothetical protein
LRHPEHIALKCPCIVFFHYPPKAERIGN